MEEGGASTEEDEAHPTAAAAADDDDMVLLDKLFAGEIVGAKGQLSFPAPTKQLNRSDCVFSSVPDFLALRWDSSHTPS